MSMVNAFITEHFIVMSGDYRRVHVKDNDIYFDDAPKVFRISDRVVVGFTGDYEITLKLRDYIGKRNMSEANPREVARLCRRWLKRWAVEDTQQSILIAGLDDKKAPAIIELTHLSDYEPKYIAVESGRIEWRLVYANENPESFIDEELSKLDVLNEETCAELAKKVNERVAAADSFVSAACDVEVIAV